jgi:hypothetical protein
MGAAIHAKIGSVVGKVRRTTSLIEVWLSTSWLYTKAKK